MTIYKTFDRADGFVSVDHHADRILQSRELNDSQAMQQDALRRIADGIFSDGDIREGARCAMSAATGIATMDAGSIYIAGRIHDVAAALVAVPVIGTQYVGIYLDTTKVTAVDDPRLYNPAVEGEGQNEPGADRTRMVARWGLAGSLTVPGDFFPVWTIEDGVVKPREALGTNSPIIGAIKDYDIASTGGGNYVVDGLAVLMKEDDPEGNQVYTVQAGEARVGGIAVFRPIDRTVIYPAVANTMLIQSEPHAASGEELQTIAFDRFPVLKPATVRVQRKKTQLVTRGPVAGGADPLNENSVVKINSVKLGGVTYVPNTDYKLTAGQVDWSPGGAEPATGNQYTVDFEYISIEPVLNQTPTTFQIANPVNGTVHYVDYEFAMRRFDRLVMDDQGVFSVIKGVPATWLPVKPDVPAGQLLLATIYQSWMQDTRQLLLDSWRMVPMQTIANYSNRMDDIELDLAELRLATDVNGRYSGLKKGYFADPMRDDSMRDQGMEQTAQIADGALQLYEDFGAHLLDDGKTAYAMGYDLAVGLRQSAYSRSMAINPSVAVGQLPASITLAPPIDRWEVPGVRKYPKRVQFLYAPIYFPGQTVAGSVQAEFDKNFDKSLIDTSDIYLREIDVGVTIAGFDPLEPVKAATFDGQDIALKDAQGQTPTANAQGVVQGSFKVPKGITVGTKRLRIEGDNGSYGEASYTGSATLKLSVSFLYRGDFIVAGVGNQTVNYVV